MPLAFPIVSGLTFLVAFDQSSSVLLGQLHSGNLLITENGCQLLDVEEGWPHFFSDILAMEFDVG